MDVVGYVRVSTKSQGESGLGQEAQIDYIRTAAKQNGWNIIAIYSDVISGSVAPQDRPEMAKALSHGLPILAAKIDRISRDVEHMASLMKRVTLKIATMPHADNFQLHLFAALAEQERVFIRGRIKEALKALQERADQGCTESQEKIERRSETHRKARMKGNVTAMNEAKGAKGKALIDGLAPHVKACLFEGVNTLQALSDCLNNKRLLTSRGNEWTPSTVRRLMISLGVSFSK